MISAESFFDALKAKRESQEIEISEICEFTKINSKYIEAIEKGDFTVLPNAYLRLFLRSYTKFIGADSAKALKDYELYTTGKITQSEELTNKNTDVTPSSPSHPEFDQDSKPHISPKQITTGIGVIFFIFILLWWAGRVTEEQTENIKLNDPRAEAREEYGIDNEKESQKTESNLYKQSSLSNTKQPMKNETE